MGEEHPERKTPLWELAKPFLRLGLFGFGGPAVHIGILEDEVVVRRGWLSRQHFLDLVGATNLIPGPNSTEMCIHIGYIRRGFVGMLIGGGCFIVPAVLLTTALAWAYVRFGSLPNVEPFLKGIKPAVLAVIASAVVRLGGKAAKGWRLGAIGAAVVAAAMLGANAVLALVAGGVVGMLWLRLLAGRGAAERPLPAVAPGLGTSAGGLTGTEMAVAGGAAAGAVAVSLWRLGLIFLKVGCVLYGTGYVLVAFLEGDLVERLGWLTQHELLDAIGVGQFTPGPLLSTSAFVGYVVASKAGLPSVAGAAVAAGAIFLPSFIFVVILNPIVPKLRQSAWTAAFLDAVNVSAVALMAAVCVKLGWQTLRSWPAWLIAVAAAVVAVRWKVSTVWLVLGGATLGWLLGAWM